MKKLLACALLLSAGAAFNANAASMTCEVSVTGSQSSSQSWDGGCFGFDYSFRNSTNGTFDILPQGEAIDDVLWLEGCSAPDGAMSCSTTIRAYGPNKVRALVLKTDGSYEYVEARAHYESGH
ncbi:hypothetical protein [Alteromonas sp. ASW11-130]|uniref:hypothetical protein n=1 Tax=Alteromonas sp. ASW11-130 TaxID=3015775 RepID=UPI0022424610|nr:hypothetical protein [Alteromonas sp. ASW11-130]MCW8092501.1 hypothetical protein [Alteromonas sp. ASW11-130]